MNAPSIIEGVDGETDALEIDVKKELVAIHAGLERLSRDKAKDEVAEVGKELFGGVEFGQALNEAESADGEP